jgi:hypothetical protein
VVEGEIIMSNEQNIPSGMYACSLVTDDDGIARFPITVDAQGVLAVEMTLWLYAKGSEQPFTQIKKMECIDAAQPSRGGTETKPYGFMALSLRNLGAQDDGSIDDAVALGLESEDGVMIFPGVPRPAMAEVSYKAGRAGGSFMNVKILPFREVTDDARAKAIEAARARKAANKPQVTPFGPSAGRGVGITPPPTKGNPFAPRTAG